MTIRLLVLSILMAGALPAGAAEPVLISGSLPDLSPSSVDLELVTLAGPERRLPSTASPAAGFQLSAPETGFWRLLARSPGAAPVAFDLLPLVEPAALPPLRLAPVRRIAVRVTNPTGKPLSGAAVRVEAVPGKEAELPAWRPAPVEARTDPQGSVSLEVAPSVPLRLTVTAPGFAAGQRDVAPGKEPEIQVRLQSGESGSLDVVDGQGRPAPGVAVATAAGLSLGSTDEKGHLAVTVPRSGETTLRLTAPDCRWAQGTLRPGSAPSPKLVLQSPWTVRGQVVDRQTREPIAGAWVWIDGLPSCSARTDASGRYSVSLPGSGEPRLRAAAAGHRPEALLLATAATQPGPLSAPLLALAAVAGRMAAGRVVDLQGRPVVGAEVLLVPSSTPLSLKGIEKMRQATLRATTDARGGFTINRLGAGPFDLQARARGFLTTRVRRVAIPPGQGTADLGVVSLQPGTALDGIVIDPAGDPVAGANVQAQSATGVSPTDPPADGKASGREAVTDDSGAFSLTGFRDGEVLTLRVARRGFSTRTLQNIATPAAEPLTVELTPAARIAGTVLDESGKPVPGTKLLLTEDPEEGKDGKNAGRGRLVSAGEVDSAGRFELVDLAPGRFRLSAVASGFLPGTRGGLTLIGGQEVDSVELVLHRGAAVEGQVLTPDGSPAAGARVLALESQEEADLGLAGRPETLADGEGRYRLSGLTAGERTIRAEHAGFRPASRTVQLQDGVTPLDLQLRQGYDVSGRVSGPEGPVAGAAIELLPQSGSASSLFATSGADGGFRFQAVGEGSYRIQAEKSGYAAATPESEVRVEGAAVSGLELRLERGGAIAGQIHGLPFQDLAQVQIVATSPDQPGQAGRVDYEGRYRIDGLGPGAWKVIATLPAQGRQAGGLASLVAGQAEARLDLEFTVGFALSGRVERGGVPVNGALILVESAEGSGGNAVTGADGRFRVQGLHPGTYALTALEPRSNLRADQHLEIENDREIVVALPEAPKPAAPRP
jgi:hypothetical protein